MELRLRQLREEIYGEIRSQKGSVREESRNQAGEIRDSLKKEIKEEIIKKVKEGDLRVPRAAKQYGISDNTIYGWFSNRTIAQPGALELAKLKKQNQLLTELVGRITLELDQSKKKNGRL
jgi:transposase-like protein